ncbi:hypothetical protein H1C71_039379 [Ictidomys tridecemlineatus]|nr:hypothetical protein H1C71_039379 [Ictidomys tridecemlineatus]
MHHHNQLSWNILKHFLKHKEISSQAWWCISVFPEDCKLEASLSYVVRPWLIIFKRTGDVAQRPRVQSQVPKLNVRGGISAALLQCFSIPGSLSSTGQTSTPLNFRSLWGG